MPKPPAADTAPASLPPAMTSMGADTMGCVMPSCSVNRVVIDMRQGSPQRVDALTWHQLVGVLPARQRANPLGPRVDIGVALGPIVGMLLGWIVDVARHREVGDGRLVAGNEFRRRQVRVDDGCGGI